MATRETVYVDVDDLLAVAEVPEGATVHDLTLGYGTLRVEFDAGDARADD